MAVVEVVQNSLNGVRKVSETMKTPENTKKDVQYLIRSFPLKNGTVKFYKNLAGKLSNLVQKRPAWSWRYVQSVYHGTMEPSQKFVLALERFHNPKPPVPELEKRVRKQIATMARQTRVDLGLRK